MIESPGLLFTVVAFLLVIGPLVFVHEMGHFLVARACGVRVDKFSIGFGREIFGWTDKKETRWKIGWLPLGGYVQFAGDMNAASQPDPSVADLPEEEKSKLFQFRPVWQRFAIVAAGPLINFLLAIVIYMGVFAAYGQPQTPPVVTALVEGSAAERAGFELGDRVVSVDGREIDRFEQLAETVIIRPEQPMEIVVLRDGGQVTLNATPEAQIERDRFGNEARIGRLGLMAEGSELVRLSALEIPGAAVGRTVDVVEMMVVTIGQIVTGRRSVEELGGPLRIAQISGQQASLGILTFLLFLAVISINLGFINLLPIPMLDGGHLLLYSAEAVRRKPIEPATQEWAFRMGLAVLLCFMLMVTVIDLGSFGLWERLSGLIG